MAATLVGFFAVGFFAATLLPLFRMLALILAATLVVVVVALIQGIPLLKVLGLACGSIAISQVGYGLGLAWCASVGSRSIHD